MAFVFPSNIVNQFESCSKQIQLFCHYPQLRAMGINNIKHLNKLSANIRVHPYPDRLKPEVQIDLIPHTMALVALPTCCSFSGKQRIISSTGGLPIHTTLATPKSDTTTTGSKSVTQWGKIMYALCTTSHQHVHWNFDRTRQDHKYQTQSSAYKQPQNMRMQGFTGHFREDLADIRKQRGK